MGLTGRREKGRNSAAFDMNFPLGKLAAGLVGLLLALTSGAQPVITNQPASVTANFGAVAKFSCIATGTPPVSYQWFKENTPLTNGGNIFGSTNSTLTLSNLYGGVTSAYSAVATDASTLTATSAVATLTVIDPAIVTPPADQVGHLGGSVAFSVTAVGTGALSYQWWKGGTLLLDATNVSLALTNLQLADAANYDVVVCGDYGCVTSTAAALYVNQVTLDSTFNATADNTVYAIAMQPDGKILLGGIFTNISGQPRNRIARLNADGTLDASFNPGASGYVQALAVQPDGKIVVAGSFTNIAGQTRNWIGRLNADGTLDAGFNPGAGGGTFYKNVYSLLVQPDGKILVGGDFTTLGGQSRTNIGRLNAVGTLDTSFNPGSSGYVTSLAFQPDNKIILGGYFNYLVGQPFPGLGRLNYNGTLDTSFNTGGTVGNTSWAYSVQALAVQPDGRILFGGYFNTNWVEQISGGTSYHSASTPAFKCLSSNGAMDNTFNGTSQAVVNNIILQADGSILAGGWFSALAGQLCYAIGRLNPDGSLDPVFKPTPLASSPYRVYSLAEQLDGNLLVGGTFTNLAGQSCVKIGRLNKIYAATNSLTYNGTNMVWLRGGSTPEFGWTTFEYIPNGGTDFVQAAGSRISGGWQLAGVSMTNGTIRARGYLQGGYLNGSAGILESSTGPLIITTQPFSQTSNEGLPATFSVVAAGSNPSYQWRKGGISLTNNENISGANAAVLNLGSVQLVDGGDYDVVITNIYGSVTSMVATLTPVSLTINPQPSSRTNNGGTTATFTIGIVGTGPFTSQWWKDDAALADGTNIFGSTNVTLMSSNVTLSSAGGYSVIVSNSYGCVTSLLATLTVVPFTITNQPASRTNNAATAASFSVGVSGTAPFAYKWRKSGVNLTNGGVISGSTTATLNISSVMNSNVGGYDVVITNSFGSITSALATLTVVPLTITIQPASRTNLSGTNASFSVSASSSGTLSYQWLKEETSLTNSTHISGSKGSAITVSNILTADAGAYSVVLTNIYGAVTSRPANLTVVVPPQDFAAKNSAGALQLQLTGTPNYPYILQSATNFTPPINWQSVLTNPTDGNGNWQFIDTNLNTGQKFYRAIGQ